MDEIEAEYDERHDVIELFRSKRFVMSLKYSEFMSIAEQMKKKRDGVRK